MSEPLFAAAVYGPDTKDRGALTQFAFDMKNAGVRVGGLVQEPVIDPDTGLKNVVMIDVENGDRDAIKNPRANTKDCTLDAFALTEKTAVLRRNVADNMDLVVIEKFGLQEQKGEGLFDEIFATISAGIPVIVAVPDSATGKWEDLSGGLGEMLDFTNASFERWWKTAHGGEK